MTRMEYKSVQKVHFFFNKIPKFCISFAPLMEKRKGNSTKKRKFYLMNFLIIRFHGARGAH